MRRPNWPVTTGAAALGAGATAVVLAEGGGLGTVHVVLTPLVGWSFTVAGLLALTRPRWRRVGALLTAVGLAWFVHLLAWADAEPLRLVGQAANTLYAAIFAHLLLAFPTGRLVSRPAVAVVAAGYLDTVVVQLIATVRSAGHPISWVRGDDGDAGIWYDAEAAVGVVLAGALLVLLARRWHAAPGTDRPTTVAVPVAVPVAAAVAASALVANLLSGWFAPRYALGLWVLFSAAFAAVPFGFLASLLGVRLRRAGVVGLLVRLGRVVDPAELRDALARALHDDSLELAYWVPARPGYVDAAGRAVELPADGDRRVASPVERDGRRIGALVHDRALLAEPELVAAVQALAGLALDNARLHAELAARLHDLAASRTRLVEAAAAERRRIERNLHDGAQQRLVSVAMALGLARARLATDPAGAAAVLAEAGTHLTGALDDLRRLGQGIHPGVLTERGLRAAVAELCWAAGVPVAVTWEAPDRLPEPVESAAYYVVAESLANTAKHASAGAATVRVSTADGTAVVTVADDGTGGADPARGTGLRGLADRVAAIGGSLSLASPPGAGTTVRAELPCG